MKVISRMVGATAFLVTFGLAFACGSQPQDSTKPENVDKVSSALCGGGTMLCVGVSMCPTNGQCPGGWSPDCVCPDSCDSMTGECCMYAADSSTQCTDSHGHAGLCGTGANAGECCPLVGGGCS